MMVLERRCTLGLPGTAGIIERLLSIRPAYLRPLLLLSALSIQHCDNPGTKEGEHESPTTKVELFAATLDGPKDFAPQIEPSRKIARVRTNGRQRPRHPKSPPLRVVEPSANGTYPASVLANCHVCFRRPRMTTHVPLYNDCEACYRRVCYICARVCMGPTQQGYCGMKICSKCCVEQGVEGTAVCLDCLDQSEWVTDVDSHDGD